MSTQEAGTTTVQDRQALDIRLQAVTTELAEAESSLTGYRATARQSYDRAVAIPEQAKLKAALGHDQAAAELREWSSRMDWYSRQTGKKYASLVQRVLDLRNEKAKIESQLAELDRKGAPQAAPDLPTQRAQLCERIVLLRRRAASAVNAATDMFVLSYSSKDVLTRKTAADDLPGIDQRAVEAIEELNGALDALGALDKLIAAGSSSPADAPSA